MSENPRSISVVIPLFNGRKFITQALESVSAQTLRPLEIIVVDDGSTDEGAAIVAGYANNNPVTLLRKSNGGQSSARNFGIRHAQGELVALLDQDDVWYPAHLEELSRPFGEAGSAMLGWTYSNLDEIGEDDTTIARAVLSGAATPHPRLRLDHCLREDMFILPSASMIARAALDAVGGFDETLSGYEDDDLFVRLFVAGYRSVYVDRPLGKWRVFSSSSSYSPRMAQSRMAYARKLLKSFPNDHRLSRYYASDLIAPRFLPQVVEAARVALRNGNEAEAEASIRDISFLEHHVSQTRKTFPVRNDFLVTAVIPLYNGGAFIAEAIQSILRQTVLPDEVIVVDDGSTDNGADIVRRLGRSHPIRLIPKPNGGQSSARNLGVEHAHGDLIAFLDQDDVWYPDHLEQLLKPFQADRAAELGWSYSDTDEVDESGAVVSRFFLTTQKAKHPKRDITQCLEEDMFVLPSAALISRRAFRTIGGFDEQLSGYEDDDLFLRLFQAGYDNAFIPRPLSRWRIFSSSSSYSPRMAESRMAYARKLLTAFANDDRLNRYYASDLIAPRFLPQVVDTARKALHAGGLEVAAAATQDLQFLEDHVSRTRKTFPLRKDYLITAIVPLFNGGAFIAEALQSIARQKMQPDEVIVVDDGSTDNGPDIVSRFSERYPIRLIRKPNGGQSSARNLGVDHAHGDLIAFLDQDDIWYPDHLEQLLKPFQEERAAELGWSYSDTDEVGQTGAMVTRSFLTTQKARHPKRDITQCLKEDMFVLPSASLISRRAFQATGGFDERLSGYEDDDLFLRLFQAGYENAYIPRPLSRWRIYQTSSSYSWRMAASRSVYMRKLMQQFPDDPDASRYYTRDLIAPRFFFTVMQQLRKSVVARAADQNRSGLADLHAIVRHLRLSERLFWQVLVLPLLHVPWFARLIMRYRVGLYSAVRRFI